MTMRTGYATVEFKDGHSIYREVSGRTAWLQMQFIHIRNKWRRYWWSKKHGN